MSAEAMHIVLEPGVAPASEVPTEIDHAAASLSARQARFDSVLDALVEQRDRVDAQGAVARCLTLEDLAGGLDEAARRAAGEVCAEARVLPHLAELDPALRAALRVGGDVPIECAWVLDGLAAIETDWARAQRERVRTACGPALAEQASQQALAALEAARDGEARSRGQALCWRLARGGGPRGEARRGLTEACAELDLAVLSEEAEAEVDAALSGPAASVPRVCTDAIERLGRLGTTWALERKATLGRRCFDELGTRVLARHLPGRRHTCPPAIRQVLEGAAHVGAPSPGLRLLVARAQAVCPDVVQAEGAGFVNR